MTLVSFANISTRMASDIFVWSDARADETVHHLCGASFVGGRYYPNNINFGKYYAFDSNSGIGVTEDAVSLVRNGKKIIVIPGDFEEYMLPWYRSGLGEETAAQSHTTVSSGDLDCWIEIKQHLQKQFSTNPGAQQMLKEITEWESRSLYTLQAARETIKANFSRHYHGLFLVFVADQDWLFYNGWSDPTTIAIGRGNDILATASLPFHKTTLWPLVAPLYNSWVIRVCRKEFLPIKNKPPAQEQPLEFPFGFWYRCGAWTLWPTCGDILFPNQQLILDAVPRGWKIIGATQSWMFLNPACQEAAKDKKDTVMAVNQQGEIYYINIADRYGENARFCVGSESAFATWESPEGHFLSVEDASGERPLRQRWAARLFARKTQSIDAMGVITGPPDIAVILFTCYKQSNQHVCLISANNKALLLPPITRGYWMSGDEILVEQAGNKVYINRAYTFRKGKGEIVALERMGNDRFRVFLDSRITLEAEMKDVSPQFLSSYLESGLAAESDS